MTAQFAFHPMPRWLWRSLQVLSAEDELMNVCRNPIGSRGGGRGSQQKFIGCVWWLKVQMQDEWRTQGEPELVQHLLVGLTRSSTRSAAKTASPAFPHGFHSTRTIRDWLITVIYQFLQRWPHPQTELSGPLSTKQLVCFSVLHRWLLHGDYGAVRSSEISFEPPGF